MVLWIYSAPSGLTRASLCVPDPRVRATGNCFLQMDCCGSALIRMPLPGPRDWFRGHAGTRKDMQNDAGKRMSVCLARVSIYMFPVCGGPIRVRGDVLCMLPTADSDVPLSRWKKKKAWTALDPPPPGGGKEVCAFLPLNLRTCVRPLIMGPVDMLHLRRRKTPLCPAPLSGVGVVVGRLGTAASQTLVRG